MSAVAKLARTQPDSRCEENSNFSDAASQAFSDTANFQSHLRQERALATMGRLAGGVAHDFNNLLTGILLYCDLLVGTLEPGHRGRNYAEKIRGASLQASGLVRQLLTLSHPGKGQARLLSFNNAVLDLTDLLRRLIGENIELDLQLDSNLGLVSMEPTHAQQVVLNLVLNARDAMPEGGDIKIETRNCRLQVLANDSSVQAPAPLPCALLVVHDNGKGMDESTRAHAFEPFFTTKGRDGTGLGLAIVYEIVTSSGGLVQVDSRPNQGTQVSLLLPLASQSNSGFAVQNPGETESRNQQVIHEGKTSI